MSAPTPGARERLLAWAKVEGFRSDQRANLLIAAQDIEAEARAALRAELAATLRRLPPPPLGDTSLDPSNWYYDGYEEAIAAVLALLDEQL